MKKTILSIIKPAFLVTVVLLVVCGLIYPLLLTGIGQLAFNHQANSSLIEVNGQVVGSEHVGQQFTEPYYFKGRVSAYNYNTYTEEEKANGDYSGVASGGSNYANSNPELQERVEESIDEFLAANPGVKREDIPADLMTASGSGLDPDITPESAEIQIAGVSKASGIPEDELRQIVKDNTDGKFLGIFGEETVNVLKCNIEIAKRMGLL